MRVSRLQHSRHEDVVDWDVDELDEEANETHYQEPDGGGLGHLHELCAETNRKAEGMSFGMAVTGGSRCHLKWTNPSQAFSCLLSNARILSESDILVWLKRLLNHLLRDDGSTVLVTTMSPRRAGNGLFV